MIQSHRSGTQEGSSAYAFLRARLRGCSFATAPTPGRSHRRKRETFLQRLEAIGRGKGVPVHGIVTGSRHRNLKDLLKTWDESPKSRRKQILEDFVTVHENCIGTDLEEYYGNGASLLLSRISSWLRLTYTAGYAIAIQLRAIQIFISAGSSTGEGSDESRRTTNFLVDFMQTGCIVAVLEILGLTKTSVGDEDRRVALELLRSVAQKGRKFKRILCMCQALPMIAQCVAKSKSEEIVEGARELVLELGIGNPDHSKDILGTLCNLLSCDNSFAQRMSAQTTRQLLSQKSFCVACGINRERNFDSQAPPIGKSVSILREQQKGADDKSSAVVTMADFLCPLVALLSLQDLEVQYEASELLVFLGNWEELLSTTFELILPYLVNPKPEAMQHTSRFGHANGADGPSDSNSSLPQLCAINLIQRLLKVVDDVNPRIFETILANGTMHGLIGSLLNTREFSVQRSAADALRMLCSIYPRAVEAMGDVAGNEISSKIYSVPRIALVGLCTNLPTLEM